jgi:hypothetical protein
MRKIDFLGIGAPRCGSTWLAQCLYEHPKVIFPNKKSDQQLHHLDKEMNFFSEALFRRSFSQKKRYQKGIGWYLNQFNWDNPQQLRGEFSVGYFADHKAPQRIKEHFPQVKLIAILRNPIKMVYSAYYHLKALVHTKVPDNFDQAVKENNVEELRLDWGLYAKHLSRYISLFPKKNIKIILLNEVKQNPDKVIDQIYQFLEVDSNFTPPSLNKKYHSSVTTRIKLIKKLGHNFLKGLEKMNLKGPHHKVSRNRSLYLLYQKLNLVSFKYPPMKPATKNKLKKYFQADIGQLEKLINKDLSFWLNE